MSLFSPKTIGRFSSTTRIPSRDTAFSVPRATNFPTQEHTYCSPGVSDDHVIPRPCLTCLFVDGAPLAVGLTPLLARLRHPTISNTPTRVRRMSYKILHVELLITFLSADGPLSKTYAPTRPLLPHFRPPGCERRF
jgi:hypothetical protein